MINRNNLATKRQTRYIHFLIHKLLNSHPGFAYSDIHLFIDYKFHLTEPQDSFYKDIPYATVNPIIRYLNSGKVFYDMHHTNASPKQVQKIKTKIAENRTSSDLVASLKKIFHLPAISTKYVRASEVPEMLGWINDYTKKQNQILADFVTTV